MNHGPLHVQDGALQHTDLRLEQDVVVVGSGPAGAVVARDCARAGASVTVVEEGPHLTSQEHPPDSFSAMALMYRDMGTSIIQGNLPMPMLQGRVVGGTSVINGAICWRLPQHVHREWVEADPALAEALPFQELEAISQTLEQQLNIHPTPQDIAGANNLLLAKGAQALGLEHRPIRRNVQNCVGLGRCLQGCPQGNKLSMDRSFLPQACQAGARILSACRALQVDVEHGRAVAVRARTLGGARVTLRARRAVVLAASAVQTPQLLLRSGLRHGPVGRGFQCHPGVSMAGRFPESVRLWTGATQGHEVIGLTGEGIKFEALGYDLPIAATRLKGVGQELMEELQHLGTFANWGAAIRSTARGRVHAGWERAHVTLSLTLEDVKKLKRSVRLLGEMMLAAGAQYVTPGVAGWHPRVMDRAVMQRFEEEGPNDPKAYAMAVTHMFSSCAMGSHADTHVVRPDFRHHRVAGLYLADSSVFPSNTGVNPQLPIMALATLCARHVLAVER